MSKARGLCEIGVIRSTCLEVAENEPQCQCGRIVVDIIEKLGTESRSDRLIRSQNQRLDVKLGGLILAN